MLPNHAPLVVAEQFGTLEALHPGRIDLGIGRAPGTDQRTAAALRRLGASSDDLPAAAAELLGFFERLRARRGLPRDPRHARARRRPAGDLAARLERLQRPGGRRAGPAVRLRPPLQRRTTRCPRSTSTASTSGRPTILDEPYAMVTAMVVCAPDDDEANLLASAIALSFARMRSGYPPARLPTVGRHRGARVDTPRARLRRELAGTAGDRQPRDGAAAHDRAAGRDRSGRVHGHHQRPLGNGTHALLPASGRAGGAAAGMSAVTLSHRPASAPPLPAPHRPARATGSVRGPG